jgi:hypothetical protein
MELNLKIIGILLILLGILHVIFLRYFKWKQDFIQVSHINRQMMYVHAFFIALMVFLLGLLCITSANEIISTNLGKKISLGIGIFWTARLLIQFFGYSSLLWKGKTFETTIHILFSVLWIYLSMIFLTIYFIQ